MHEGRPNSEATDLLKELPTEIGGIAGMEAAAGRYRYGYIGLSDRRMIPILRPGSVVLVDTWRCLLPIEPLDRALAIGFSLYSCFYVINDTIFEKLNNKFLEMWGYIWTS